MNIAKEILADYWETHKNDGITATYMLIGKTNDGGIRVEVVKDVDLEKSISKYDSIVSKHIYSLQKNLIDIESLAGEGKGDAKFGAIKCKESIILSDEELFKRRWGINTEFQTRYGKPNETKTEENKKVEQLKVDDKIKNKNDEKVKNKNDDKVENKDNKDEKVDVTETKDKVEAKKVSPTTKSKVGDKKVTQKKPIQSTKTGFNNLFGKVSNQKKTPPVKNEETTDKKSSTPDESNVKTLFDKKTSKNDTSCSSNSDKDNKKSSPDKQKEENKKSTKDNFDLCADVDFDSPMEIDEPSSPKKAKLSKKDTKSTTNGKKTIQKTKSERGTKRGRSQDTSDSGKKRKRIVVLESSDESDTSDKEPQSPNLFESSELEETVTPPIVRSPSPVVQVISGKRKVRKTIDEKYMDEDGYLVTKKVQVMQSASEDDEPVPVPVKPAQKKVLPPSKTTAKAKKSGNKQTTLTSFFTKK